MTFSFWSSRLSGVYRLFRNKAVRLNLVQYAAWQKGVQIIWVLVTKNYHPQLVLTHSHTNPPKWSQKSIVPVWPLSFHNPMVRLWKALQIWQPLNATPKWSGISKIDTWKLWSFRRTAVWHAGNNEKVWWARLRKSSKRRSNSNLHTKLWTTGGSGPKANTLGCHGWQHRFRNGLQLPFYLNCIKSHRNYCRPRVCKCLVALKGDEMGFCCLRFGLWSL